MFFFGPSVGTVAQRVHLFIQNQEPGPQGPGQSSMALPVKNASCFGALEHWSTGVLECWKKREPEFQLG